MTEGNLLVVHLPKVVTIREVYRAFEVVNVPTMIYLLRDFLRA